MDPDMPHEARQAIVEHRLDELHRAAAKRQLSDEQWAMVLWLIDVARSFKLLRKGSAWGIAVLTALAGLVSQWDAVAGIFKR
jgi:hypothetical protein